MDILIGIGVAVASLIVFYVGWKIAVRSATKVERRAMAAQGAGAGSGVTPARQQHDEEAGSRSDNEDDGEDSGDEAR